MKRHFDKLSAPPDRFPRRLSQLSSLFTHGLHWTRFTDAAIYQEANIQMYGFTPGILPPDFPALSLIHGHDERVPVSYIASGLPALWQVLTEIGATY